MFIYLVLGSALFAVSAHASWTVKQTLRNGVPVSTQVFPGHEPAEPGAPRVLRSLPAAIVEGPVSPTDTYLELVYADESLPQHFRPLIQAALPRFASSEVRTLVNQGPSSNRIDLTIVGDGYTEVEKERFFADAARITDELFNGHTFASYLPLFNVHAVFVASRESGITDVEKKDTALGLFREPPGSKRAIDVKDKRAADAAIALAPATDYPILLANDDFYGGLGGKYAITTRSERSGIVVLRHELGHNFGEVGEEYDGGSVYRGANNSLTSHVPWKNWLTAGDQKFEAKFLSGDYVWQDLGKESYRGKFTFPAGGNYSFEVLLSSVGWSAPGEVEVLIDGQKVSYEGEFTNDRGFFNVRLLQSPAPGSHSFEVREAIHDGDNVLAFAEVYAYPPGYDTRTTTVAAYGTYRNPSILGRAGYRPTHDACLMRNMDTNEFCAVDKENMWLKFLARVNLIDGVQIGPSQNGLRQVLLNAPRLHGLQIRWSKFSVGNQEIAMDPLDDKSSWQADSSLRGKFRVRVKFVTREVRSPNDRFEAFRDFEL